MAKCHFGLVHFVVSCGPGAVGVWMGTLGQPGGSCTM